MVRLVLLGGYCNLLLAGAVTHWAHRLRAARRPTSQPCTQVTYGFLTPMLGTS
jgi:hypothetical protein